MSAPFRLRPRRAVSPIIATILLVAIVVVLAAVLFVLVSTITKNVAAEPPLGAHLVFGQPLEGEAGLNHWYNFTVQLASGGLVYQDLGFQLLNVSGSIAHLPAGATFVVHGPSGSTIATYNATSTGWPTGGLTQVAGEQVLSIYTGTTSMSGGHLVTVGLSSFAGSISTTIP